MFLRIEFGRITRQAVQTDVRWYHQRLGDVRTGSIDDHDDEVFGVGGTDLRQKDSHLLGIHDRADPPVPFSFQRADRSIDILKLPLVAVIHHRTLRGGCPAAPNPHHPSKASLVLKHQPNVSTLDHVVSQQGFQHFGEFFFQSACTSGLLLGWRVSAAPFRQPWGANSRYTTEGLTGWPSRCAKAARIGETTTKLPVAALGNQGFKKATSSSGVSRDCRRPPQLRAATGNAAPCSRKAACSRDTVAPPPPKTSAVCSRVAPNKAGRSTA